MKKALIFRGGWDGHEPVLVSERFGRMLAEAGYEVKITEDQADLDDIEALRQLDLIVPCWTMGELNHERTRNISTVVGEGCGLAGAHGGMCDAFRDNVEWQFMTGGQWVSHPGGDGIDYEVVIHHGSSPITDGLRDFRICSEQYYLHVDPANEVLATTRFPRVSYYNAANKAVDIPVAWTRFWGLGRVFYCSLGHHDDVFDQAPEANELMRRGLLWAGEGRRIARERGLDATPFLSELKMY
ncbi:MAG: ThuA domain-containing protein [Bacillota bacterium]|nr:ThuA domain-containing protein [Bacillota bacterium]